MKNMQATLFLAQGVPLLLAGRRVWSDTARQNNAIAGQRNFLVGCRGEKRRLRAFVKHYRFRKRTPSYGASIF
jgi:hypothetical protein